MPNHMDRKHIYHRLMEIKWNLHSVTSSSFDWDKLTSKRNFKSSTSVKTKWNTRVHHCFRPILQQPYSILNMLPIIKTSHFIHLNIVVIYGRQVFSSYYLKVQNQICSLFQVFNRTSFLIRKRNGSICGRKGSNSV